MKIEDLEHEVEWSQDEFGESDWLGEFSTVWKNDDSIKIENPNWRWFDEKYLYFTPMNRVRDHLTFLHKSGMAKGPAWELANEYVRSDLKRLTEYNQDYWHMAQCLVSVSYAGLTGTACLCGIESDCGDDYRSEIEKELLGEAQDNLVSLIDHAQVAFQEIEL
ncbi:hypothetical protein LCGC14_2345090 [marine sediment metagenome]|uniref:Uncharacterized protein n=1 Tax=marine sediment metagenome TaxID=412755 RepID=A0A0F9F5Z3_9ZZZZ